MTGPGEGKILLPGRVELCSKTRNISVKCEIYLHVKGYSLARVTHIDLESPVINEVLAPRHSLYLPYTVVSGQLRIRLLNPIYVQPLSLMVREIRVSSKPLAETLGEGIKSWVYMGGKEGGVFLGFRKPQVRALEALAVKLGVKPRSKKIS